MSDQGARAQRRTEDGWWGRVYQGPTGALPDTPDAGPGEGSVDDWFDSVASIVAPEDGGGTAAGTPEAVTPPPAAPPAPPAPEVAEVAEVAEVVEVVEVVEVTAVADPAPTITIPAQPVAQRPPSYGPEPTLLPAAVPERITAVVPDTVLEGAQYPGFTLRAASVRGDSPRHRGEPRTDALLVTRFGEAPDGLLLAVLGGRARIPADPRAEPDPERQLTDDTIRQACAHLAEAIGRSHAELAADLREGARDRLRYGLQRLTARAAVGLRALAPEAGSLHCLLVPLDPAAGHRAAFGLGPGGLYLLRAGHWIDAYAARLLHHPDGPGEAPEPRPFRFRLVPAGPGDILLLCSPGLAEPIAGEPAVAQFLATHWAHPHPPGTVDFLRQAQVRAKGFAEDRTAVALWTD
ncbi:hypothetical protein ACIGXM_16665 [Kitasatospora sp. NPDC052896]|uniref:hypothetical protein n=1 Tax=Kitasatospora sp. NPDC052896 TaxID=3364061 RepID=UPI0037CC6616